MREQSAQRNKLYLLCSELGLNPIERLEVARYLLRRDLNSFDSLDEDQVCRMLDAFEGTLLVLEQYRQRVRTLGPSDDTSSSSRPRPSGGAAERTDASGAGAALPDDA